MMKNTACEADKSCGTLVGIIDVDEGWMNGAVRERG